MKRIHELMVVLGALGLLAYAPAGGTEAQEDEKLEVVATLSVLRYVAEEIGGDRVVAEALSDPRQDPHYVQPRPTLMKRTRRADLFIEVGLGLELWAQKVIDGSANSRIQMGQPGRVIASDGVPTLEMPETVSREWGDVHPYGNPHVWLDPIRMKRIAENIAGALQKVDPAHGDEYEGRLRAFEERIDIALFGEDLVREIGGKRLTRLAKRGRLSEYLEREGLTARLGGWLRKAERLRGRKIVTYHKTWVYFVNRFGLSVPVEVEENPGIPPSARHRDRVIEVVRGNKIDTIVVSSFYDRGAADYVAEKTGARVVSVPIDIGADPGVRTYFDLIDRLIEKLGADGS